MPDQEKKFVQIQVVKSRKNRWKEWLEKSSEWRSMTDLIVTAVEAELRESQSGDSTGETDIDLGEVHARFDDIEKTLHDMEDGLDRLFRVIQVDEEEYLKAMARIQKLIPTGRREAILGTEPQEDEDPEETVRRTGSVSHLVQVLQREMEISPTVVREAIELLDSTVSTIEATWANPQDEDDKRIYRVRE